MRQGDETPAFWTLIHGPPPSDSDFFVRNFYNTDTDLPLTTTTTKRDDEPSSSSLFKPKLYKVGIGMGYLELPQVTAHTGRLVLSRKLLDSRSVYILDCFTDIFVWIGRKSTRLVRTAALNLSQSLEAMIRRPAITLVTSTLEGTESQIFKSKFEGWDDLIAVDYTRTAEVVNTKNAYHKRNQQQLATASAASASTPESTQREGSVDSVASSSCSTLTQSVVDLRAPNSNLLNMRAQSESSSSSHRLAASSSALPPLLQRSKEPLRTDLVALFCDRYVAVPDHEAQGWMEEMNDFLESMECFVFENKRFVRLPDAEMGQFYSEDSYLFVCKYWKLNDNDQETDVADQSDDAAEIQQESSIECKLYFWQGRDANNAGWLTFTFSLKKKFKDIEMIKFNQQQENPLFLSHFKRKMVIHKGKRTACNKASQYRQKLSVQETARLAQKDQEAKTRSKYATKMYHLRRNPYSAICTRCIQLLFVR
jgi:hypothetical protein